MSKYSVMPLSFFSSPATAARDRDMSSATASGPATQASSRSPGFTPTCCSSWHVFITAYIAPIQWSIFMYGLILSYTRVYASAVRPICAPRSLT